MSVLPLELIAKILSGLEASSLIALAATSSSWKKAATDPHMLRDVFLRSWQPKITAFCPTTPCGGLGLGKSKSTHPQPATQDWRQMFNARGKLDKNWQEGREWTHYMFGHTDSVYCVQFDENKAITGSRDRTIRVWDLHTHVCIRVIGGPWVYNNDRNKDVLEGDITPQMRLQLECMKDNGYDYLPPRRAYHTPSDWHNASILCLQYDDDILVTGSSDTTIIMWDIKTFQPLRRLRCHNSGVLDLAFDADKIVSCSKDFTICIWDRRTGDLLNRVEGHQGPVNAIQLRGDTFVSASGEGSAHLYKLNYKVQPGLRVHDAPFASCAPELVKSFWSRERGLACIEYSDDGQHILAGGNDHVIFKYDTTADQDQPKAQLAGHDGLVRSLYLDNVNGRIISGSYDLSIRAWDYDSGRLQQTWPDKTTSWILSAKSDYRRLVATSQDGKVVLMDFGANVENVELLEGMARGPQEQTASTNAREAYRQRTWNGRPDPDMLPHYNSKGWEETMMYMVP